MSARPLSPDLQRQVEIGVAMPQTARALNGGSVSRAETRAEIREEFEIAVDALAVDLSMLGYREEAARKEANGLRVELQRVRLLVANAMSDVVIDLARDTTAMRRLKAYGDAYAGVFRLQAQIEADDAARDREEVDHADDR